MRTEFALRGPGGEPVDFRRTINGHGVTDLWPMSVDDSARTLTVTLALAGYPPRTIVLTSPAPDVCAVEWTGDASTDEIELIETAARRLLRLDQDLSPFYAIAANDPDLAWVTNGAGRMTRCHTVYEDVVKTICTTNCAWSATVKMVERLVEQLGEPAPGAPESGPSGRAFPSPAAMAARDEAFYRELIRCGYRAGYLVSLADSVASGALDLEALENSDVDQLDDDALFKHLLALPGVGPYAAAHIMMMLGRYSRLILDSSTRPTYARLQGREHVEDQEIIERFSPYGAYAGLAFWLTVSKHWLEDD